MKMIKEFLRNNAEIIPYTKEYALSKNNALQYLELLKDKQVFILGGDVYEKQNNELYPLCDSWYIENSEEISKFDKNAY